MLARLKTPVLCRTCRSMLAWLALGCAGAFGLRAAVLLGHALTELPGLACMFMPLWSTTPPSQPVHCGNMGCRLACDPLRHHNAQGLMCFSLSWQAACTMNPAASPAGLPTRAVPSSRGQAEAHEAAQAGAWCVAWLAQL